LERRRHLLTFPLAVGCWAALHLALCLWIAAQGVKAEGRVVGEGLNFLLAPLLLAPFFGCFLGRTGTSAGNPYLLSSFTATRPLSVGALVAAKLKATVLAALAAWAIVLLAASVWLADAGIQGVLLKWWSPFRQEYPFWRVAATAVLAVGGPVVLTWRLLADNLWLGLTGRAWIVRGSLIACGLGLTLTLTLYATLAEHADFAHRLWVVLPWWAGGAALLKLLAASSVGRTLLRRGLVSPRGLAKLSALWLLAAAGLFVLVYGALPEDAAPVSLLASGAVLGVPLVRLLAAPLALAWNRHR
jgi:hypothetical protein